MEDSAEVRQNVFLIKTSFGGKNTNITTVTTPILVILDPDMENGKMVDLKDADNVKLWVVNRILIYFFPKANNKNSVSKWYSAYGDYQGCLTERKISTYRDQKGKLQTYRKFLTPIQKVDLHITTIPPSDDKNLSDRQAYILQDVGISSAALNIKRPYPEKKGDEFSTNGKFINGIRVIRLPAEKIYHNCRQKQLKNTANLFIDVAGLEFSKIVRTISGIYLKTDSTHENIPYTDLSVPTVVDIYDDPKAQFENPLQQYVFRQTTNDSLKGTLKFKNPKYNDTNVAIFENLLYDITKLKSGALSNVQTIPLEKFAHLGSGYQNFISDFPLEHFKREFYQSILSDMDKLPNCDHFMNDVENLRNHVNWHLENDKKYKQMPLTERLIKGRVKAGIEQYLLRKLRKTLNSLSYNGKDLNRIMQLFNFGNEIDFQAAQMNAILQSPFKTEQITVSDVDRSELSGILKGKVKSNFMCNVKLVEFATGSDGFSESECPLHAYYQLKQWWDSLSLLTRKALRDPFEVEAIGFSSRFTTETNQADNKRLRRDRAWKTAMAFQKIMNEDRQESIPCEVIDEDNISYGGKQLYQIYASGAPIDVYPEKVIDPQKNDYLEYMPNKKALYKPQHKALTDNKQRDRICMLLFKLEGIKNENGISSYQKGQSQLVIHKLDTLIHVSRKDESLVLNFLQPGIAVISN